MACVHGPTGQREVTSATRQKTACMRTRGTRSLAGGTVITLSLTLTGAKNIAIRCKLCWGKQKAGNSEKYNIKFDKASDAAVWQCKTCLTHTHTHIHPPTHPRIDICLCLYSNSVWNAWIASFVWVRLSDAVKETWAGRGFRLLSRHFQRSSMNVDTWLETQEVKAFELLHQLWVSTQHSELQH